MSSSPRFRRVTCKLPCRCQVFTPGNTLGGYRILRLLSISRNKTVYALEGNAVLCIRHSGYQLPPPLLDAMKRGTPGIVRVLKSGTADGCPYTIDEQLSPLPDWDTLSDAGQKQLFSGMAAAVESLHTLGFCHLDLKPEHFARDHAGQVKLLDLDSAMPFDCVSHPCPHAEFTPAYAAPELFGKTYSAASDLFSLGKTAAELAGSTAGWRTVFGHLTTPDYEARFNSVQLRQYLTSGCAEAATGPRTYRDGVPVGGKTAFSDRQLALYLSESYEAARTCLRTAGTRRLGMTDAAAVAARIHALDPALPLCWYGERIASTADLAARMNRAYPEKDARITELLRSGLLLRFPQIAAENSLRTILQEAIRDPDGQYFRIAAAFGARVPQQEVPISLTSRTAKRAELRELIKERLYQGNPAAAVAVFQDIPAFPSGNAAEPAILRLRAVPTHTNAKNLTNLTIKTVFGAPIVTELPEPGRYPADVNISALFPENTRYLIAAPAFEEWKEANRTRRELRHRRNVAVGKAIGWTALGAALLAALPYILSAIAVLAILAIIFGFFL